MSPGPSRQCLGLDTVKADRAQDEAGLSRMLSRQSAGSVKDDLGSVPDDPASVPVDPGSVPVDLESYWKADESLPSRTIPAESRYNPGHSRLSHGRDRQSYGRSRQISTFPDHPGPSRQKRIFRSIRGRIPDAPDHPESPRKMPDELRMCPGSSRTCPGCFRITQDRIGSSAWALPGSQCDW